MNYEQTLDYLFSQLPMYQRVGKAAYKADLSNTHTLCKLLGNPQNKFKSVHVAGTNGKGSTSHMIASVLQEAGYKVGLYTSPHLKDFRERIKINGKMIDQDEVLRFVEQHKSSFEKISLSFFEWTVGLAFHYFATQKVDIAIIETGLGGRLDSTNVVKPEVSVITNIGIDHTQFLGETVQQIAIEKAGIIKSDTPIIIGETQKETETIFNEIAQEKNARIVFADSIAHKRYYSDLKGDYQQKNLNTCLATINMMQGKDWNIVEKNIEEGLLSVAKNTGLLGRWQTLGQSPLIICDVGHNKEGIKEIVSQLEKTPHNKLHIVFGTVNDKSIASVLDILPKKACYYFCQAKIPRALDIKELFKLAETRGLIGKTYKSVSIALDDAKNNTKADDLIFIGGSTFVVAEVL